MNYEKEYNEMVQRVKELHQAGNALTKAQMETIYPPLKESEDERIRKELLKDIPNVFPYEKAFRYIHWLEKQKDNKFAPRVFPCSAAWFEDGEEKQKEQKKTQSVPDVKMYKKGYNEGYQFGYGIGYSVAQKEQKPAEWSEEYANLLNRTLSIIRWASDSDRTNRIIGDEGAIELEDWLKSLRPQPKSIISDTDKSNLKDAPAIIRKSNHPFKENIALIIEKYL